jgi:Ni,Fe-hydrogenase maturation factor
MHFIYQETHNINVDQLLNILKKNQKIDKVLIFIKVNPNLNNQQEVQFFNTVEYIFNVFQNHLIGSEISIQSYSSDFVNQYSFGIYIK